MKRYAKRFLAILLAGVLMLGTLPLVSADERTFDGTEKLYVDLGAVDWWLNDDAATMAYFYNVGSSAWTELSLVQGTVWEITVPAGTWTNVSLFRGDPDYTGTDYGTAADSGGFYWNMTGNIPLDPENNYITSFSENSPYAAWDNYAGPESVEITLPNGGFENGTDGWTFTGFAADLIADGYSSNQTSMLNIWASNDEAVSVAARYTVWLDVGTYHFTFDMDGENRDGQLQAGVKQGEEYLPMVNHIVTTGWNVWFTTEMDEFTLTEPAEITFWLSGTIPAGYWAHLDNLRLYGTGSLYEQEEDDLDWIDIENSGFENGTDCWTFDGLTGEVIENNSSSENQSNVLSLWVSNDEQAYISASYTLTLEPGVYLFRFEMDGMEGNSNLTFTVSDNDEIYSDSGAIVTTGWDNWIWFQTDVFELTQRTTLTFALHGTPPQGYWGHLDNLELYGTGSVYVDLPEIELPNGDFEYGDGTNWSLGSTYSDSSVSLNQGSAVNSSYVLNLWKSDTSATSTLIRYRVRLLPGTYKFSFDLEGENDAGVLQAGLDEDGCNYYESHYLYTEGWDVWQTYETGILTLDQATTLDFMLFIDVGAGYWGHFDNLRLYGTGGLDDSLPEIETEDGSFDYGGSRWDISGFSAPAYYSGFEDHDSSMLNLWISDDADAAASASYVLHLTAGTYSFSFEMEGAEGESGLSAVLTQLPGAPDDPSLSIRGAETVLWTSDVLETEGWDVWNTHVTDEFTLTAPQYVRFTLSGTVPAGYWGHFDNLLLFGTGRIYPELEHDAQVAVPLIEDVGYDDFLRGVDVSSYLSVVNSGAKFYDWDGNELTDLGFFQLLHEAGFNCVRIRIWVDPYDTQGHGYGGGNNDLETAKTLGELATSAGLTVLLDFHYSDFWADPGKQQAPKAWADYTVAEKAAAVEDYTYNSLKYIKETSDVGVDVRMVQIGNETTSGICGVYQWSEMAQIFSAGASAVRRLDAERGEDTLIAIHFTNPERTASIKGFADQLNQYGVDYDVFATSWYPYWHGTTENLTDVFRYVADTYGKKVMIAETSWAWTLEDGDGHDNTVRVGSNDTGNAYPFSVQGQADELVAAVRAVTPLEDMGIGVFYWENAWIPVQYAYDENGELDPSILASNRQKWETFGSGWATSYAGEYQSDAAAWYGGSAVDNQAMFDFHGRALDSLWTWKYMLTGTEDLIEKQVASIEAPEITLEQGCTLTLPETVKVTYNVGGSKNEPVTWDPDGLAAVDTDTVGVYTVTGTVTLSYDLGTAETAATVNVISANLLQNPGFEDADLSMYDPHTGGSRTDDDPHSGSKSFHFYNANGGTVELAQTVTLQPGVYTFSLFAQGDAKGSEDIWIYVTVGENDPITQAFSLAGWIAWQNPELVFEVPEAADVTVGLHLGFGAGGWGTIDDLYLGSPAETPAPRNVDVYFVDENGLDQVWSCVFRMADGVSSGDLPGTVLTPIGADRNQHNVYKTTVNASVHDHIIFSDGADWRTVDLPFLADSDPADHIVYFGSSDETDEAGHYLALPAEDVEKIVSQAEPTCTEPGSVVLESFVTGAQRTESVAALGHVWGEGTVTADPTVDADGVMTYACSRCGETRTEVIPFRFDDVKNPDKYYFEPVYWALRYEPDPITKGTAPTYFSPNKTCTRAQVVSFLWNAMGRPEPELSENPFLDVKEGKYYYKAVLWAVENDITKGADATHFDPGGKCTRAQVVTFLWNAAGKQEPESTDSPFTDVGPDKYYYKAVLWAVENGITNGTDAAHFSPNKTCTRAQVVTFLYRAETNT